ncbi:hypothetical protein M231_00953 [Tremella mesenterica]|uniref:Capsular associated protein n=1 Tax=Tremella mesenterica TaxID=5217 RepID=A0A4Q1BUL2_TREME|nr:hypothetical protein M231_00953 [Tremella mesenterica]
MLRPRTTVTSPQPNHEPDTPMSHYPSRHGDDTPGLGYEWSPDTHTHAHTHEQSMNLDSDLTGKSPGNGRRSSGTDVRPLTGGLNGGIATRRGEKSMNLGLGLGLGGWQKKGKRSWRMGLSQRGWMILTGIIGITIFTKLILPTSTDHHVHTHESLLVPRDYLNNSKIDPAPFEFCPVFGPGDPIAARRGQLELLRSRLHLGTGARVQRVIQKAMSGAPVTISVLGGSISACVGAGEDPIDDRCYPAKFFTWWNSVFPHPANELTNGAQRKTDSAYYAYCNSHHMPDKTDLVLLEFDAADPNDPEWVQHFELLARSILVRPEMPAVIILGHFSPQVQAQNGFAGPELLHNVVAQFYDVPHISVKGVIYNDYLQKPDVARASYYNDPQHANAEGHELIADVLISYMMSQICSGWSTLQGYGFDVPDLGVEGDGTSSGPSLLGGVGLRKGIPGQQKGDGDSATNALTDRFSALRVPPMRLGDRPNDIQHFREIEPFCVAASDLINPLPRSLFYGSGWQIYHPPKGAVNEDRHYWQVFFLYIFRYAEQPTSRLRIPLKLGAGDVGIYFLQSPVDKPLGTVKCWVDDNSPGARELKGTAEVEDVIAT